VKKSEFNFSIVIPIFNEQNNIKYLINEIIHQIKKTYDYEIIIVDDASTDDVNITLKEFETLDFIKIIKNNTNLGQSQSILNGIINSRFENIITIDGDGQNDPADISKLIDLFLLENEFQLVGGIRSKRKDSLIKIISSKLANLIRSRLLNDNCPDTGCSLKIFKKSIFLSFPYFDGIHRFLPALFKGYGYKTKFIKVNHRKRKYGVSKYGTIGRLFKGINDMNRVRKIIKNKNLT